MNTRDELQQALHDLQHDAFIWRDDAAWAQARQTWRPS